MIAHICVRVYKWHMVLDMLKIKLCLVRENIIYF